MNDQKSVRDRKSIEAGSGVSMSGELDSHFFNELVDNSNYDGNGNGNKDQ